MSKPYSPLCQFTVEELSQEGTLPFLDTHVTIAPNNTFCTTVYRNPTHTDQCLHWDSNHFITAKHSVYNTLAHRAKITSSNQGSLHKELNLIRRALQAYQSLVGHSTSFNNNLKENITTTRIPITKITLQTQKITIAIIATGTSPL